MINVNIVGRLTGDPEEKTTNTGQTVTRFTIASKCTNQKDTEYINIVTWRGIAENCAKYLVKGQRVYVIGELKSREYNDKKYTEVIASQVEFLDKPKKEESSTIDSFNGMDLQEIFNKEDLPF